MEALLELILGFFFELFLQIMAEVACELGAQSLAEVFKRRQVRNPWLASLGYFLLGNIVGAISLVFFDHARLHKPEWRMLNLFLTPVLAGLSMMVVGAIRRRKGQELVRLDRFGYGFLFAFGMALVRFLFATK